MEEQEQAVEQEQEEQQTEEVVESEEQVEASESTESETTSSFESGEGITVISDIERTKETIFRSINGDIHLIHEITLGDVILAVLLAAILVFLFLDRVIRR